MIVRDFQVIPSEGYETLRVDMPGGHQGATWIGLKNNIKGKKARRT